MPKKLIILIVLLVLAGLSSFASESYLAGVINLGLAGGLFKANDVVRKIAMFLHVCGLAMGGVIGLGALAIPFLFIPAIMMFVVHGFGLYTLTRPEVIGWMLNRGIADLEAKADQPSSF